jgi:TonB family protein
MDSTMNKNAWPVSARRRWRPALPLALMLLPIAAAATPPAGGTTPRPCGRADLMDQLHYPITAARCGLEGSVTVQFEVAAGGRTVRPLIVRSTHRIFNRAVLEGVGRLQCSASASGTKIEFSVDFTLVDGAVSKDRAHACVDGQPMQPADAGGA